MELLLALQMEESGHKPRNVGGCQKLEIVRSSPGNPRKKTDTLILAP